MHFLIALLAFFSVSALARNHMVFMGGGGEPAGAGTIFDSQISKVQNYRKKVPDLSFTLSFNGGHSRTESKMQNSLEGVTNTPFTSHAYEAIISRYEDDINQGRITSGDQLMLMISTHGAEKQGNQLTHNIATSGGALSNYETLQGAPIVPLDRLQSLAALAESKNIKLAVVDMSCHSGASLALANSKTCVVTATGPNHFGYAGSGSNIFVNRFLNGMRPGRNLEEVFLDARKGDTTRAFPMISSPAAIDVQDEIYPLISRFLNYYKSKRVSKLAGDISSSAFSNSCEQEDETLQTLLTLTEQVEEISNHRFRKLRELLTEYQELRASIQEQIKQMNSTGLLSESRQTCHNGQCFAYTGKEVLSMNLDKSMEVAQKAALTNPAHASYYNNWAQSLIALKPWQAELRANPVTAGFYLFYENYPDLEKKSGRLSTAIAKEERQLYKSMFEERSRIEQRPNPCRDFRL